MTENASQTPPRVLIVDNEKRTVNLYAKLVKFWGYTPVIAEGIGEALIGDAKTKAKEFRCQMAVVDLRLMDDQDADDVSGLDLIEEIKPAETIIVSGRSTLKLAVDAVTKRKAADFFGKNEDPGYLREKLDGLAARICAAKKTTRIGPVEILDLTARTLFAPQKQISPDAHDQPLDMLVRLFPNAETLRLKKTGAAAASSDFSTVPRPRSVVLQSYEDDLQPVIVKIAREGKIKKEVENFDKHIKGRLVGHEVPHLEDSVTLWDVGGIKLSYVETLEGTFTNFVSTQPVEKIAQCLEYFFAHTWSDHYKKAKEERNVSLFELYCSVWDRDWVDRANKAVVPDASAMMPPHIWQMAEKNNPLEWLKSMAENQGSERDPSMVEATRVAVTHGDLHADNLLIDDTQHGWVVDFERTGEGHALQDFVELEADIITRIACAREDFPAFYRFCATIAGVRVIDEPLPHDPLFADEETQKLLATIAVIRKLAVRCTGITDFRQYLLGLYFNTIFRATITPKEQQKKKDLRAWMLASILCHRLAGWQDSWPPVEWNTSP